MSYGKPEGWADRAVPGRADCIEDAPLLAAKKAQSYPTEDCDMGDELKLEAFLAAGQHGPPRRVYSPPEGNYYALNYKSHLSYLLIRDDEIVSRVHPVNHDL